MLEHGVGEGILLKSFIKKLIKSFCIKSLIFGGDFLGVGGGDDLKPLGDIKRKEVGERAGENPTER